jgi:TolA-binding protein
MRLASPIPVALFLALIPGLTWAQDTPAPSTQTGPPQKTPPPGRIELTQGWQSIRFADFPTARKRMQSALEQGDTQIRAEAVYALGYIHQYDPARRDNRKARELYAKVINDYAGTPAAPWAHLALARMADLPPLEKNRDVARAREIYRAVIEKHPKHMVADEAVLRLAYSYLQNLGDEESVATGLDLLAGRLEQRPDNFLAPAMHLAMAQPHIYRQRWSRAVGALVAADEADARGRKLYGTSTLSQTVRSNLYWQIGRIAEEHVKDAQLARKYYLKIVEEIGRDNKAYVAGRRAKRLAPGPEPGSEPAP